MIYADYAAASPMPDAVFEAVLPWLREQGNPSALYAFGRKARDAVDAARVQTAALIGAEPSEIIFTASGTESDNMALEGIAAAHGIPGHIISTAIEHPAVLRTLEDLERQGFSVTLLPVDGDGFVNPADVEAAIREDTVLVSVMAANNEIGTIQPLAEIGKITRKHGILFHTDAVQAAGHIPLDVNAMEIDLLSVSGHKLGAPRGIGALYIRKGTQISPLLHGGGQEFGLRSGTENVAGIVGMGAAAELAQRNMSEESRRLTDLRDRIIRELLRIPCSRLTGHPVNRLPGTASFCFAGIEGEALVLTLDLLGAAVSSGSACSAGSQSVSHVLRAIGVPEFEAQGSLRISVGFGTTSEEADALIEKVRTAVERLREMSPVWEDMQKAGV